MIKAERIPLDTAPLSYIEKVLREKDGGRVCAIVPTTRAIGALANKGFETVDIYAIKDFTQFATDFQGIHIPKQLRSFYLKKAADTLSRDDKIAIFRKENSLFLDNFMAFAQTSMDVFSFYRELSSEMIDAKALSKAGKYTDYELQLTVLEKLWQNYLNEIKKDGYSEELESCRIPILRESFISRYDTFVFLIGGYLTKYELERLKLTAAEKEVLLLFNYAGKKHKQHEIYEKYLGITLDDRPTPVFNEQNTKIYACSSMAAQLELITSLVFNFEKEKNINPKKMAVIIPDESIQSYFLRLDPYNLFDIVSGEDITSFQFFQILKNICWLVSKIQQQEKKQAEIADIIKVLSQPMILQKVSGAEELKRIYLDKLSNNKLYTDTQEMWGTAFFKDYCKSFHKVLDNKITPKEICKIIEEFISGLSKILSDREKEGLSLACNHLDMLFALYDKIEEKMDFSEASSLILNELSQIRISTPMGEITVMGILESRNINFDVVFIPAMNEDTFPPKNKKDLFLNTEMRKELDLPTFADRENLIQNYLLQIMERAKYNVILYSTGGEARSRSRFVEEIAIHSNIKEEIYAPKEISFFKDETKRIHFPKAAGITIEKTDAILKKLSEFSYSATTINNYKKCSLMFYLTHIACVCPQPEPEKMVAPSLIGSAFHYAFKQMHEKKVKPGAPDFAETFNKAYLHHLNRSDAFYFNEVENFIVSEAGKAIKDIEAEEIKQQNDGWEQVFAEKSINCSFDGHKLKGQIDRIDRKGKSYRIIDYKFKKKDKIEKDNSIQMPFYALLLELDMKVLPVELYYFDIKESFQLINAFDMAQYETKKKELIDTISEISDASRPFVQTDDSKKCEYCSYREICGR